MSHYDDVVAKMLENEPGVLEDFMFEAGLGDDLVQWDKIKEEIEFDLLPKRQLRDLVGTKVFPSEGRKIEKWARGVPPKTPRVRRHVRGYLFKQATQLIARSATLPANSPRRLSDDLSDKLQAAAELSQNDLSERAAKIIWEALECAMRDGRESASLLVKSDEAFGAIRETIRETVKGMLQIGHDEPHPDPEATSEHPTTH
jgi:hypothetical protein